MTTKKSEVPWMNAFKLFLTTLSPEEAMKGGKYEAAFKAGWEAAKNPLTSPTVKAEDVSKEIDSIAQQWLKDHEERWGEKSAKPDPSMVKTGQDDAADLGEIAKMVFAGKFKAARDAGASLDTIVRDELPDSFFKLLEQNNVRW
jgi:hypothetical protein